MSPELYIPLTPKDKARFLKKEILRATYQKPLWVNLQNPEILPWASPDRLIPQKGTIIAVICEKNKQQAIVVDFTRTDLINNGIPFASFPLSAVEIKDDGVWINCKKAIEDGTRPGLNLFIPNLEK
ncbi:MAG: hypothetical protein Q7K55_09390 [Candidatus Levybacteria bacterium]|nr:hypothetical protein [Candidatus Levybacteria bacterium]